MTRRTPRRRRYVSPDFVWLLRVLGFRYSAPRHAYVLRLIGESLGPVYLMGYSERRERKRQLQLRQQRRQVLD